ncbi:MAG: translation initiation factor 1 [Cellvibrionaceae bacterium]|jgi:translation initiation factor 1
MKKNSRLVYSTETGRVRVAEKQEVTSNDDGVIRIFRESRKGSGVSVIAGLPIDTDVKQLAKSLKKALGVGGSIKNNAIEIQSDQREKIRVILMNKGFNVKIAGG